MTWKKESERHALASRGIKSVSKGKKDVSTAHERDELEYRYMRQNQLELPIIRRIEEVGGRVERHPRWKSGEGTWLLDLGIFTCPHGKVVFDSAEYKQIDTCPHGCHEVVKSKKKDGKKLGEIFKAEGRKGTKEKFLEENMGVLYQNPAMPDYMVEIGDRVGRHKWEVMIIPPHGKPIIETVESTNTAYARIKNWNKVEETWKEIDKNANTKR